MNPYAPILYKILTFSIVENHGDSETREFFLVNFIQLFEKVQNIPVGIVIEPLVKQINVSDDTTYVYNTFDFDFFISVARHQRLSVKHGLQLMDVLGKIYLNDFHYFRAAGIAFMLIANRHASAEALQEYLYRFCCYALLQIQEIEKSKKPGPKEMPMYNGKRARLGPKLSNDEQDEEMKLKQKRYNVVDIIEKIIKCNQEGLNERIKDALIQANTNVRKITKANDKGIIYLLDIFGDGLAIIDEFAPNSSRQLALT